MRRRVTYLTNSFRRGSKASISSKGLNLHDYGEYLRDEDELNRRILTLLSDGPLQQKEIVKRLDSSRRHIQDHLAELITQGCVSSLMVSRVCKLYFLPLDVSKSNSWDYEKQLYKRSRTPKEGGRSKRFTYLRLQD